MLWPIERAAEVLRWYRDFIPSAPDDLNGFFAFLTVPPAPPFPEELGPEDVRRRLVLHRPLSRPRRPSRRSAPFGAAGARLGRADPAAGAQEHVRRALPGRLPVVLEGRLLQRDA